MPSPVRALAVVLCAAMLAQAVAEPGAPKPVTQAAPSARPTVTPLDQPAWRDASLPVAQRVASLVAQLTVDEKLGLMTHGQAAVPRLGLPAYNFWTECLHGHLEKFDGAVPTIFPQPLLLASTFDEALALRVYTAISDELRAKANAELAKGGSARYLNCWTPHINIFRDPRWGRGSETFGEDPVLTARLALRAVQGLQGSNATYKKVIATCKHFLGYGLEEAEGVSRYAHDTNMSPQDLADTELPPFRACIQGADAKGVMCAYNSFRGTPSCASSEVLQGLLRQQLGFDGYIISDCNAVAALTWGHRSAGSLAQASADALNAGVGMFCESAEGVAPALKAGLVPQAAVDAAVSQSLAVRFLTGQFDPPSSNPWAGLQLGVVNSPRHRQLAREVVHKGIVLLKNGPAAPGSPAPLLPLSKAALRKLCVVGPLADSAEHMMGNYYGNYDASAALTPRQAIEAELAGSGVEVAYAYGMDVVGQMHYDWPLEAALEACRGADAAVVVVGASMLELNEPPGALAYRPATEGEGLDRANLTLPGRQADLLRALMQRAPSLPLAVVLLHGGGFDVSFLQDSPRVASIVAAGFPGQEGGRGLADVLFGAVSPSGRLPITWYRGNYSDVVSPLDLGMRPAGKSPGRSYRFLTRPSYVLYPFGHGLAYTTFAYSGLTLLPSGSGGCSVAGLAPAYCALLRVTNTGTAPGEHAVPLFLRHVSSAGTAGHPLQAMRAFARTRLLAPGESQLLSMGLSQSDFALARESDGTLMLHRGDWRIAAGTWDAPTAAPPAAGGGRNGSSTPPRASRLVDSRIGLALVASVR